MNLYRVTVQLEVRAISPNEAYDQAFNDMERMMEVGNEDGHLDDYTLETEVVEIEERKVEI